MLEWLKTILGDNYTEEVDKQVSAQIGKDFVARSDFNTLNETKKTLETTISDRDKDIGELRKAAGKGSDLEKQLSELQGKYQADTEALNQQIAKTKLDAALDAAIAKEKGKNPKAIKALLDADKLKLKDDGSVDGLDLAGLKTSDPYLFEIETKRNEGTGHSYGNPADDAKTTGYQTRLTEARAKKDTVAAIQIKQEAAAEGVILL